MKIILVVLLLTFPVNAPARSLDGKVLWCESIEPGPRPSAYVFKKGKVRLWELTKKKSGPWKRKRRYTEKYKQSDYYISWALGCCSYNYLDRKTLELGELPEEMEQQCSLSNEKEVHQRLDAQADDLNEEREKATGENKI